MEIADGILNNWDCGCRSGAPLTPSLTLKESLTDAPLASRSPVETPKMADDDAPLSKELVAESLMVDGLTEAEHEATKQFLEEVGRCTENEDNEPIAWHTAVKFLMARKFDVRRAVDLYLNHEKR